MKEVHTIVFEDTRQLHAVAARILGFEAKGQEWIKGGVVPVFELVVSVKLFETSSNRNILVFENEVEAVAFKLKYMSE